MRINDLKEADFHKYFEARLQDNRLRKSGRGWTALCPFHNDNSPSLSINMEAGVWNCHTGCGNGGVIAFEEKFSSCDKSTALKNIAEIIGQPQLYLATGNQPEAIYGYVDPNGIEVFQVVRNPGKKFIQRRKGENGEWIYKTADIPMCLYHLDEVISASELGFCEGEKDADNLRALLRKESGKFTATTSPRGAGKWKDAFAPYFSGKKTIIFQDNDPPGIAHALQVANSIYRYANGVKIVSCPEVKDVSDYLKTHTVTDLIKLVKDTPTWKPEEVNHSLFMTVTQFEERSIEYIDWIIEGLIQRGANGIFLARPKAGKSIACADLALALASGQKWLDFFVPKRAKVALVSREDNAALTQWRIKKLRAHRGLSAADLDGFLYINAKGLRPKIMLDNPDEVAALIADLKRYQSEFLILDVMRVMHGAEENDSTEMQKVIDSLNRIQDDTGCSVCLVHHTNKREDVSLTESARGAGAIAGWAEYVMGIKVENEEAQPPEWVRKFLCELKASLPPDSFYYRILDTAEGAIKLERVDYTPPVNRRKRSSSEAQEENLPF